MVPRLGDASRPAQVERLVHVPASVTDLAFAVRHGAAPVANHLGVLGKPALQSTKVGRSAPINSALRPDAAAD